MPQIISTVNTQLKGSDYFQFRAPTGMGVIIIPYLILFRSKKGWFKYAGNWQQLHAPIAYRFQRWLLKKQSRKVTINGVWENQPSNCLSFENPCLTQSELEEGRISVEMKTVVSPMDFCFVGRLEYAKGVDLIIDAILNLSIDLQHKIGAIHLVGDGTRMEFYKRKVAASAVKFVFHGFLSREQVKEIYKTSAGILLPSFSEGFPKVIAEAINYGCVPIVSDVSSISQYIIDGQNGFLLNEISSDQIKLCIERFLKLTDEDYIKIWSLRENFVKKFTYDHYNQRLLDDVL